MGLFEFFSDGRKDTSHEVVPTRDGYEAVHNSLLRARDNGKRVDPNDPTIRRLAAFKGKTVEDYVKYDLHQEYY